MRSRPSTLPTNPGIAFEQRVRLLAQLVALARPPRRSRAGRPSARRPRGATRAYSRPMPGELHEPLGRAVDGGAAVDEELRTAVRAPGSAPRSRAGPRPGSARCAAAPPPSSRRCCPRSTIASASPSRTASRARTIDESFFVRTDGRGSSSISITSRGGDDLDAARRPAGQQRRRDRVVAARRAARATPSCVGGLQRAGDDLARRAVAAHGVDRDRVVMLASPAVCSVDVDHLAAAVPAAVAADDVRQLHRAAVRAQRARRRGEPPVRRRGAGASCSAGSCASGRPSGAPGRSVGEAVGSELELGERGPAGVGRRRVGVGVVGRGLGVAAARPAVGSRTTARAAARAAPRRGRAARGRSRGRRAGRSRPRPGQARRARRPRRRARRSARAGRRCTRPRQRARSVPRTTMPSGTRSSTRSRTHGLADARPRRRARPSTAASRCTGTARAGVRQQVGDVDAEFAHGRR